MRCFEISWFGPHFGEEPPITGKNGSGTIFFCRCNLRCVFCQNWQISQFPYASSVAGLRRDKRKSTDEMLKIFFELEKKGCHNINLVSPTMWATGLEEILYRAKNQGLKIPILWNSNAYETARSLGRFRGMVDIYLPDYKYADDDLATKYSNAPGYSRVAREAILEMQKQVGDLMVDKNDVAKKGLIVRHLVLPGCLENTKKCLEFIRSISENVHLSLMSQYNPAYKAKEFPEINRTLTKEEYEKVLGMVEDLKFEDGWIQEFGRSAKCLNPDFRQVNPFSQEV